MGEEIKVAKISDSYLVKKRNVLNEVRNSEMTLQELRFFNIYLSKINPEEIETRLVRFKLEDFQKIMKIGRLNIAHVKQTTDNLLRKIVTIPNEKKGYDSFQLFKKCRVAYDEKNGWYVEIDAHDDALPLMFEYKSKYFTYELKNTLYLKSENQLRMYEILKQYEHIGSRILSIEELRELLFLKEDEYKKYTNFKTRVLETSRISLEKNTDIKFTYEPYGAKGKRGKILKLKFNIFKNEKNKQNEIEIEKTIDSVLDIQEEKPQEEKNEKIVFLLDAVNNIFTEKQMHTLYLFSIKSGQVFSNDLEAYNYFLSKYTEMEMRNEKNPIKNKYGYIKKLIEIENQNDEKGD